MIMLAVGYLLWVLLGLCGLGLAWVFIQRVMKQWRETAEALL